jgi:hypothetical protein
MADLLAPFKAFVEWIDLMESSIALRESTYVWGIILVAHLMTMGWFAGLILMMDLRLLGIGNMQTPFSELQRQLFPWQMLAMALTTILGLVLWFAQPLNYYANIFFWMKMVAMGLAGLNAMAFHFITYDTVSQWDSGVLPPFGARLAGGLGIVLWATVVMSGRLLPYNWFK